MDTLLLSFCQISFFYMVYIGFFFFIEKEGVFASLSRRCNERKAGVCTYVLCFITSIVSNLRPRTINQSWDRDSLETRNFRVKIKIMYTHTRCQTAKNLYIRLL